MMRKIDQLLNEYGESHQHATNKAIHWICVPLIFWSVVALISTIPSGFLQSIFGEGNRLANWAVVVMVLAMLYYISLSIPLSIGMLIISVVCLVLIQLVARINIAPVWAIALIVFTLAWIGQFYGHKVEGKKPSFFKDIQFLLIGPAWLMHFIFKKLNIPY
jgi:uncharacterized membrane protein YGL010W